MWRFLILFCFVNIHKNIYSQLVYKNSMHPIETRVQDLLKRMTLKEKILQLNQYTFGENDNPNNIGEEIKNIPADIGSLIYLNINPEIRNNIQRKAIEESRLGIPILFGFDVIHGLRTVYPIPLAQACSFNPKLITAACRMAAKEATLSGINWTFSPMVDIARDARWGRIAEGYGEDPYLSGVLGAASVKGYQSESLSNPYSIAACLKHFVGYGMSEGGRDYRPTDISKQALWETYLPPFEMGIKSGAATIMSSFNDISGIPATANHYLLNDVLKNKWNFKGFVVSDWNAIEQLTYQGVAKDRKEAAYKAFTAGLDMDMRDNAYGEFLEELIEENKISEEQIDSAVVRILRLKFHLGLFERPYTTIVNEAERYLQKEDVKLASLLAEESMVLLKNQNKLLPLSPSVQNIAVIGPLAKNKTDLLGSWAFRGNPKDVETIYEGLEKEFGNKIRLNYALGCKKEGNDISGFEEALKVAKASDLIILCLGEDKSWSGENASRSTIALPRIQEELLTHLKKAEKPIVLILSNGRPLELARIEPHVDAIVEIWQPGIAGGSALAGILSGRLSPSGKLSVTFPRTTGQIPIYYNMRQTARPYGNMGNYQDIQTTPLYPFGYGLSYTNFTYTNARISSNKVRKDEKLTAEVTIINTGKSSGKETVLWYIADPVCSISRPIKELKHFEKCYLLPGESCVLRFEINPYKDLSYVNSSGVRFLESGKFILYVGTEKLIFEVVE